MAEEKKKGKLKEIRIKFHHSQDGENDGFSVEHHMQDTMNNDYLGKSEDHGSFTHHGKLMEHLHEHVKDHGAQQSELSGGKGESTKEGEEEECACPLCDDPDEEGAKEVKKAKLTNIGHHGYEKHTANDPHSRTSGHSSAHPGFKAVQNKIAAKEGLSHKAAGAILAARSRGASHAAHKANPRLNRVKG